MENHNTAGDRFLNYVVRPWQPSDKEGAIAVVRSVFDEYSFTWDEADYHADLYDVPGYYLNPGGHFWVAEANGKVVGTVALEYYDTLPGSTGELVEFNGTPRVAGTDCSLERLYVCPDARRFGIGTALVEVVLKTATENGRLAMELWSDKRFGDAHRLYGRFGATVVGDRISDDPDDSPEWGLVVRLNPSSQ